MSHLRSILPYFRPYRRGMAIGLALVAISNAFTVAGPYLMKLAIDALYDPDVTRATILGFAGLIVAAAVVGGAARYGMREILNGISRRIECDLRVDFFRHLLSLDANFYSRNRTGDIMSRATNDTLAVRQAAGPAVMYAVNTTVTFTFALSLMLWISPRLTALALIPMIFLPPIVLFFGRVIHRRFEKIQSQFSNLSTMVQENLTGVRLVRAYGQEMAQANDFREMNRQYMERNMHLVKASGLFHPLLSLLTGSAMVVVLWIGGGEVMAGRISVGDFVAFTFYLNLLIWPMIALGWVVNLFQRGAASMARINEFMETTPAIPPAGAGRGVANVRGGIEFRNVSFRYPGTERLVLQNVSFRVAPGETVAVVGPTGSGKSTLVALLPRIYDPTDGEILLDGVPLQGYDPGEIRRITGMVPQDTFLFSETIRENIALGMEDEPEEGDVRRAAEIAQLHESVEGFPRKYETHLGERGINLSGGQKQRTTLARALARVPVILILDDALSAVDTHTESRILTELRKATREQTAFIISHRVSAVMHADRILVLEDGEIVEEGRHEELIAAKGLYASLLRRQMLEQDLAQAG
jgi:ATP-binding cassette, subfamily B, multidrug efflux pump